MTPSGLLLLHKQPGITSFDSLRDIKRALGTGKAGHTGTLDKFAEGLLLVLTGRALKLSKWFTHCDKQYEGVICFGAETDTLDPEGSVIANAPVPSREAVEQALAQFRGEIAQAPPAYSAIHIDGERASALARRGEAPEMQKRPVTIFQLELRSWQPPFANIFVHCSSGTYIRSLARDIALAAGSCAYLSALVRTRVAGFKLEEVGSGEWGVGSRDRGIGSREWGVGNREQGVKDGGVAGVSPAEGGAEAHRAEARGETSPLSSLLPTPYSPLPITKSIFERLNIPCLEISPAEAAKIRNGKPLTQILKNVPQPPLRDKNAAALFSDDEFIAIIERSNSAGNQQWKYGYVYAHN